MSPSAPHSGRAVLWLFLLVVVIGVAVLGFELLVPHGAAGPARPTLVVYCAAGLRPPVQAAIAAYEKANGATVQVEYGGSQTLLAKIALAKAGDLYVPADDSYLDLARDKGLIDEVIPLAVMHPVLVTPKGNPRKIAGLDDLQREDVRLGQADPAQAAIGKVVRAGLEQSGRWAALEKHTLVLKPTVNDVANDLKIGAVDAGFLWDAMLPQYPELVRVPAPELEKLAGHVSVAVLRATAQPPAALRLARFLAAGDRGLNEFRRFGYQVVEGDVWEPQPELRVLSGAMLRPGIEQTLKDFEAREGVRITRVYNGCGILVAQMRAGDRPDAYFSCDTSFMNQVTDLFLDPVPISRNDMLILVPKGNPKHIAKLDDLTAPGMRIGLGHEEQSALGALTRRLLDKTGTYEGVRKNVVVYSPTGDFLVNQLRAGALDATIVYKSNAAQVREYTDAVMIDLPAAIAVQPYAVAKASRHQQLMTRLLRRFESDESRRRFEGAGFHWAHDDQAK